MGRKFIAGNVCFIPIIGNFENEPCCEKTGLRGLKMARGLQISNLESRGIVLFM